MPNRRYCTRCWVGFPKCSRSPSSCFHAWIGCIGDYTTHQAGRESHASAGGVDDADPCPTLLMTYSTVYLPQSEATASDGGTRTCVVFSGSASTAMSPKHTIQRGQQRVHQRKTSIATGEQAEVIANQVGPHDNHSVEVLKQLVNLLVSQER